MTYIYQTLNQDRFVQAFEQMGRRDQFSVNARRALYNHYCEVANDTGEPLELDVIAICCEWSEYESFEAYISDTGENFESIEELMDRGGSVITLSNDAIVVQNY